MIAVQLPAVALARLMRRTWPIVDPDLLSEDRLGVVRLEWDGTVLHAVATDRYRLAWARYTPAEPPPAPERWAVHLPAVSARALAAAYWQLSCGAPECHCGMGCEPVAGQTLSVGPLSAGHCLVVTAPGDLGMAALTVPLVDLDDPALWPADEPGHSWRELARTGATAEPPEGTPGVSGTHLASVVAAHGEPCWVRVTPLTRSLRLDLGEDYTAWVAFDCRRDVPGLASTEDPAAGGDR